MRVMVEFMKTMFVNGTGLAVWISLLLAANMVLPLVFITTVEAQLVLAAAIAGAVTQTAIFASRGFVRLMGIGPSGQVRRAVTVEVSRNVTDIDDQ